MEKTNKKIYPTNPLGVIALFVFFIEVISASTLYALNNHPELLRIIVIFIVSFPSGIAILFFLFLWSKPASFFSPKDYQDDNSFLSSLKKELNFNSRVIKAYTGPPTIIEESFQLADEMIKKQNYLEAIRVGRGYLKFGEFYKSYKFFEHIKPQIPKNSHFYVVCIGNIGYSLVGLEKFNSAISIFKSIECNYSDKLKIWHIAPLAFCLLKSENNSGEFKKYLDILNNHPQLPEEIFAYKKRYPELAKHLELKITVE